MRCGVAAPPRTSECTGNRRFSPDAVTLAAPKPALRAIDSSSALQPELPCEPTVTSAPTSALGWARISLESSSQRPAHCPTSPPSHRPLTTSAGAPPAPRHVIAIGSRHSRPTPGCVPVPLAGSTLLLRRPAHVSHRNAPLSIEGRRRLVQRCQSRPIAYVVAGMGISRRCASKWVNHFRRTNLNNVVTLQFL